MQKLKDSNQKIMNIMHKKHDNDLILSGVRVYNLKEGEDLPEKPYQDQSVNTVIINRKLFSEGTTTMILRR